MKLLRIFFTSCLIFGFQFQMSAQITVSQSSFQQTLDIGKVMKFYFDTLSTRTSVNVGKKGGPNTYDFSSLNFALDFTDTVKNISAYSYLASRYTAGAMTFKGYKSSGGGYEYPIIYFENSSMTQGGNYQVLAGDTVRISHSNPHELFVKFPVTFGDSTHQTSLISDTMRTTAGPFFTQQNNISSTVVVDGWGTLKLPGNVTTDCLRFRFVEESPYNYKEIKYVTNTGILLIIGMQNTEPDTGNVVLDGSVQYVTANPLVSVERTMLVPNTPMLEQNYPNPFNPSTEVRYYLPSEAHVRLSVYSILGEELQVFASGQSAAGWHSVNWNASSRPSGIYFLRLETGTFVATRKLVLLK